MNPSVQAQFLKECATFYNGLLHRIPFLKTKQEGGNGEARLEAGTTAKVDMYFKITGFLALLNGLSNLASFNVWKGGFYTIVGGGIIAMVNQKVDSYTEEQVEAVKGLVAKMNGAFQFVFGSLQTTLPRYNGGNE